MQLKHRPLRQQYSRIIDKAPGFRCSGAWPDAESALANLPGNLTDVVLMDIVTGTVLDIIYEVIIHNR